MRPGSSSGEPARWRTGKYSLSFTLYHSGGMNMRRLLLTAALALCPMLALADEHVAGQWRADLGHGVLINMDVLRTDTGSVRRSRITKWWPNLQAPMNKPQRMTRA